MTDKELEKIRTSCELILTTMGDVEDLHRVGLGAIHRTYKKGGLVISFMVFDKMPDEALDTGHLEIVFKGHCAYSSEDSEHETTGALITAGWHVTPRMVTAIQKAVKKVFKENPNQFILEVLGDLPGLLMATK